MAPRAGFAPAECGLRNSPARGCKMILQAGDARSAAVAPGTDSRVVDVRGHGRPGELKDGAPGAGACRLVLVTDLVTSPAPAATGPGPACQCHPVDLAQPDRTVARGQPSTRLHPILSSSACGRPCGSPLRGGRRDGTPPSPRPVRPARDPAVTFGQCGGNRTHAYRVDLSWHLTEFGAGTRRRFAIFGRHTSRFPPICLTQQRHPLQEFDGRGGIPWTA
jgi:hypothetical protein